MTYELYSNPQFHFAFERPEEWLVEETQSGYPFVVSLLGPKAEGGLHSGIALQVYVGGVVEGPPGRQFDNTDDFTDDWINGLRANQIEDIVETQLTIDGLEARRLSYSGTLPRELEVGGPLVLLRRDVAIFQKGTDIYVLDYMAEDSLYFQYVAAFARALESFRFVD